MLTEDKYFDLKGLAEYSSISVRTLRDYINNPENPLPAYRLKRKILVKLSEFDAWVKKHRNDNQQIDKIVNELTSEFI